jgi:hypothetical protein
MSTDEKPGYPAHEAAWIAANLARNRGYAVFPCRQDKKPFPGSHGFQDASNDPAVIAKLWERWPGELVAIATGAVSGFDVLDLDPKHPSAGAWWRANQPRIPSTTTYKTRSGGLHLCFQHASGLRNSTGRDGGTLPPGCDVRADGGYVVSWFAAGFPCLDHSPIAPWPQWLVERLLRPEPTTTPPEPRKSSPDRAIEGLLKRLEQAGEGNRNATLHWAACRLGERIRAGEISRGEAEMSLIAAARHTGLGEPEAKATIKSGLGRTA